ncbi:MAG: PD-(D/E)XK motif protein, partial [Eggerthellaceae bacterium]|nr:PD-(D/E)XK motif protein [Eggerthellaceae bacterium]MBQ9068240.1 PD-(D/E)XK motif protein [Eggerthellaceae bacterium]
SPFWQISGVKTKYDFCFRELNLEVKTTPRQEPMVQLKHSQLFNGDRNYLAFVQIEESPSGCSVLELAAKLKETGACFMGMRESMVLEKELLRIREEDQRIPYRVKSIEVYSAELINPFVEEIPDNVSRLEYMLNLVGQDSLEQSQIQYWVLQEGKPQAL